MSLLIKEMHIKTTPRTISHSVVRLCSLKMGNQLLILRRRRDRPCDRRGPSRRRLAVPQEVTQTHPRSGRSAPRHRADGPGAGAPVLGPGARLKRKEALTHPATRESLANVTRREMSPTRGQWPRVQFQGRRNHASS